MAVATKIFIKVSGVQFTPGTGTAISLTKATDVDHARGGQRIDFYGDGASFPSALKLNRQTRGASVQIADKAAADSVPLDTYGTLTWIEWDFTNGVGTGARTYTLANCKLMGHQNKANETAVGMASLNFEATSVDGTTEPLTFAVAP